jgi:hypothetical protein
MEVIPAKSERSADIPVTVMLGNTNVIIIWNGMGISIFKTKKENRECRQTSACSVNVWAFDCEETELIHYRPA